MQQRSRFLFAHTSPNLSVVFFYGWKWIQLEVYTEVLAKYSNVLEGYFFLFCIKQTLLEYLCNALIHMNQDQHGSSLAEWQPFTCLSSHSQWKSSYEATQSSFSLSANQLIFLPAELDLGRPWCQLS